MSKSYDFVHGQHTSQFVKNMYKILRVVKTEKKYFKKHPKHLAWLMHQYECLDMTSRFIDEDGDVYWGNPKYPLIELGDELKEELGKDGEDYGNLIYDAWGVGVSNDGGLSVYSNAECKKNKTMEDYFKLYLDPNYKYTSIYANEHSVENQLICVIGNGMDWNKDGFMCYEGPSGCDETQFYNFQFCTGVIPKRIKNKLPHLKDSFIQKSMKFMKRKRYIHRVKEELRYIYGSVDDGVIKAILKLDPKQKKKDLKKMGWDKGLELWSHLTDIAMTPTERKKKNKEQKKINKENKKKEKEYQANKAAEKRKNEIERAIYYPMCKQHSKLCTMPENAHESYVKAGIRISARILSNPYEETDTHNGKKNKRENPEIALTFLKKWADSYPEYTDEVFKDEVGLWKEFPLMIDVMNDWGLIQE